MCGLLDIWASCRGENRVSGGVDTKGGDEERESFILKCSVSIKVIPDVHCLILNKLMILSENL